ncbi:MAG: OmpH family outer membrane protein [Pseudomonadota bacterium]
MTRRFQALAARFVAAALLAVAAAAGAHAQDAAAPAVLVVNIDRVLKVSSAGASIQRQAEEMRDSFQRNLKEREDALLSEERSLAEVRESLDRDTFETRARAFEENVRKLRRDRREIGEGVQRAFFRATAELKRRLQPVLIEIMNERKAGVMLDTREVLLSATALDVTEEAIAKLDAVVGDITLEAPETPSGE